VNFFTNRRVLLLFIFGPIFLHGETIQCQAIPGVDQWTQAEQFYTSCLAESKRFSLDEDTAYFYHQLATVGHELGQFTTALDNIDRALLLYSEFENSTKTRLNIIDARILKGRLLGGLDQHIDAFVELLAVFEDNLSIRGTDDPETVRLYKHLGWRLERLAKKEIMINRPEVLDSIRSILTSYLDEIDTDFVIDNTPLAYLFLAQKFYEKALQIDRKTLGENHPDTAKSYSLIGWILGDRKNHEEALKIHQKALAIRLKCYSEIHPNTARSYSNIGWNYEQLGDLVQASQYYTIAIRIMKQVLPQDHPELEKNKENLYRVTELLIPKQHEESGF